MPPRSTTRASEAAETDPTQRDRHLQSIAKAGRTGWQVASGYNKRSRVEMAMARFKLVIGNGLRSQTNARQDAEIAVAVHALNRMVEFGRPTSVRIA